MISGALLLAALGAAAIVWPKARGLAVRPLQRVDGARPAGAGDAPAGAVRGAAGGDQVSRRAEVMGRRAARSAGSRPPTSPITTANAIPAAAICGVTRNAKAISLKLWV